MFAIIEEGKILKSGTTIQSMFQYSVPEGAGFTDMSEFMRAKGVIEVVHGERKDPNYYFVTEGDLTLVDGVPTQVYINTARNLEDVELKDSEGNNVLDQSGDKVISPGLKTTMTGNVKRKANSELSGTDWMVIRKAERDVAIPSATATFRAAVITECTRLESAIAGAADVDALKTVMDAQNWPTE